VTDVLDAPDRGRFERREAGGTAFADYRLEGEVLTITHVESPPALRGTGAAGRLMQGVCEIARARRLTIRPLCTYAARYIQSRPALADLLAEAEVKGPPRA